jgi:hypothetical protein
MVIALTGGHFDGNYQGFYSLINDQTNQIIWLSLRV